MTNGQAVLELNDVHSYYGNIHALKGISLKVDEGEIVTLIGANGAGISGSRCNGRLPQRKPASSPLYLRN